MVEVGKTLCVRLRIGKVKERDTLESGVLKKKKRKHKKKNDGRGKGRSNCIVVLSYLV